MADARGPLHRYSTVMEPAGEMYHGAFAVNVQRVKHLLQLFPPPGPSLASLAALPLACACLGRRL